jgi:hypothetical protein
MKIYMTAARIFYISGLFFMKSFIWPGVKIARSRNEQPGKASIYKADCKAEKRIVRYFSIKSPCKFFL